MVGPQSVNNRGTSSSGCTSKLGSVSCLPNFTLFTRAGAVRQKKATAVALLEVTPKSKYVTQNNICEILGLHDYIANHVHRPNK